MKKENKKTNKKLFSAFAMLMLSAAMLGTATYAWFTMNKEVTVSGMKLKATAENGLVISDYTKDNWATSWDITMGTAATLAPTSTPALAVPTFVRAESDYFDDADAQQPVADYTALTLGYDNTVYTKTGTTATSTETPEGIGSVTGADSVVRNYTLLRKFFIKGTGDQAWAQNLVIDEVNATPSGTATKLDNSLRVLVVVNGTDAFIYAPIQDAASGTTTMSYKWKNTTNVTALAPTTDSVCTSVTSIPTGATTTPIEVDMYMYFEGEDANCKSSNASGITLNDIEIDAKFKTADIQQQQQP